MTNVESSVQHIKIKKDPYLYTTLYPVSLLNHDEFYTILYIHYVHTCALRSF